MKMALNWSNFVSLHEINNISNFSPFPDEEIGETAIVGEYVIDRTFAIPLCDFKILCHLVSFHFRSTRF